MDDDRPLSFMAQVNLADTSGLTNGVLPATGLLSFFYDAVNQPWGFDPADSGGRAVRYWPANAALVRCEYPSAILISLAAFAPCGWWEGEFMMRSWAETMTPGRTA